MSDADKSSHSHINMVYIFQFLNDVLEDSTFRTYYRSCSSDLCNSGKIINFTISFQIPSHLEITRRRWIANCQWSFRIGRRSFGEFARTGPARIRFHHHPGQRLSRAIVSHFNDSSSSRDGYCLINKQTNEPHKICN